MVVDGQEGLSTADQTIASWLRNYSLPVLVAVNKCESPLMGAAPGRRLLGFEPG